MTLVIHLLMLAGNVRKRGNYEYVNKLLLLDYKFRLAFFNPLNAELNPICPLLILFGAHHILHINK